MRRLLSLFFLSAFLPTLVFVAVVGALFLRQERLSISRRAGDLAQFSAALVERELIAQQRAAQMIARSPALDQTLDEPRLRMLGLRLLADEPLWRAVSVSNRDGLRLLDMPRPIAGRQGGPVVEMASHRRVVETGETQVGAVTRGPGGKAAFAVRAPVWQGDQVRYVVSIIIEPKALGRLLSSARPPPDWRLLIVDERGRVVSQSGAALVVGAALAPQQLSAIRLAARSGTLVETKTGQTVAARPIPGADWIAATALPARLYATPLILSAIVLGLGLVGSLIVALLLARLARRELASQSLRLTQDLSAQRLEALGRMTGGVAHDFNNLLTPILAGLDLLSTRLKDDPRNGRLADAALASADRAKALVQRLLSFARRQDLSAEDVDLAPLLRNMRPLIEQSVGVGVVIEIEVGDEPLFVRVDPSQLELAILNLAVNARDAMPAGGRLTLSGETVSTRAFGALKAGRYVRVSLTDTGQGMDEETLRRAAEPFFTTKPVGKGTGLGLSMAHGLAAQSGGTLTLESRPNEGATVRLWLPPGAAPSAQRVEDRKPTLGGDARVLLVDDDADVLAASAAALQDRGFAVRTADGAEAALRLLDAERFDALVTDLTMPGADGAELARLARANQQDLPILLLTGFARPDLDLPAATEVLEKPFRVDQLAARITDMLKGERPPRAL